MIRNHWLLISTLRRPIMIHRGKLSAIRTRLAPDLHLSRHCGCMWLTQRRQLCWPRPSLQPASSAVVARPHGRVIHYVAVVNIPHATFAKIVRRPVVVKVAAVPIPALVAHAKVPKPIVHIPIEPNVRSPISMEERIPPTGISPVRRRPQRVLIRRFHPRARNPVVPLLRIIPISRCPNIPIARYRRLQIFRHRRRRILRILIRVNTICRLIGRVVALIAISAIQRRVRCLLSGGVPICCPRHRCQVARIRPAVLIRLRALLRCIHCLRATPLTPN